MNSRAGSTDTLRRMTLFVSAVATLASMRAVPAAGQLTGERTYAERDDVKGSA